MTLKILFIDHYDSFSYNIKALLHDDSTCIIHQQHDEIEAITSAIAHQIDGVILSPGPGHPQNYLSTTHSYLKEFLNIPLLGICLGHQIVLNHDGALCTEVKPERYHGRLESLDRPVLFFDVWETSGPFVFYNSLGIKNTPFGWTELARDSSGFLAAAQNQQKPWWSIQFHPESFRSHEGDILLKSFLKYCLLYKKR